MSMDNRKELEEAMRREGRLPPNQMVTLKFPVLHYGYAPIFDEANWDFKIHGAVEKPLTLSWEEFNQIPRVKMTYDLHCVTSWSKFDTLWEGVFLSYFVKEGLVKPLPEAKFIMQRTAFDYSTNLPMDIALSKHFMLATHFDGEPITHEHGHPLRGLVGAIPGEQSDRDVYLWKGAKWLRSIEFMIEDQRGFWERAGYHNEGRVWKEERLG